MDTKSAIDTTVCPACGAATPEGSIYCPECGAERPGARTLKMAATERESEILLANANVLRMRRQWREAEARCVDVLRKNPNNIHAHSLLGDIYRDQGRLDDAAQWYQMALDLDPNSASDRSKLADVERLRSEQASRKQVSPKPAAPSISSDPNEEPLGTQNLLGLNPVSWLRGLVIVAVAFAAILLVTVISIQRNRTGTRATTPPTSGQNSAGIAVTMPPLANTPSRPSFPNNVPVHEEPPAPSEPPAGTLSTGAVAERERDLEQSVLSKAGFGPETSINSVALDTSGTTATIVLTITLGEGTPSDFARSVILQNATRVAQIALASDARLDRCTVQARLGDGSNRPAPIFRGTADRATLQSLPLAPDGTPGRSPFRDAWWAPDLHESGNSAPGSLPGL